MHFDGAGVTELADHLGMSKSTMYVYLRSLEEGGLISRNDGEYKISHNFITYAEYVRNKDPLFQVGKKEIDKLANETGQYAHIVVEEKGRGINLYKARGEDAVGQDYQVAKYQQRDFLHITASGKAILAHLPRERVIEIIETHGLPGRTEETITNKDSLLEELDQIKEQGFASNDEEEIEGFRAVGAPIQSRDGDILGSLSVSGPISIFQGEKFHQEIPNKVMQVANIIEVNINMANRSSEITEEQ